MILTQSQGSANTFPALSRIDEAGQRDGREVSVCGGMAHEVAYVPFLFGIGARALGLDRRYLPQIQDCIESISIDQVKRDARELLDCQTVAQVARLLGVGDGVSMGEPPHPRATDARSRGIKILPGSAS